MVEETIAESGERWGMVSRIARQLGIGEQTLRNPVERAEIDTGRRPGTTTDEKASQDRRAGKGSPRAGQSDPQVGVSFFRVYVKRTRPP
jgi:transposase-like protein